MNPLVAVLVISGLGCFASLAMLTALASAGASLANGIANAAASTALLTSQCTSTLLIVIALFAGGVLGAGIARLQVSSPQSPTHKWLPGPNANWQRLDSVAQAQLPPPQTQPISHPQMLLPAKVEDDDELSLQGWGF